LVRQPKDLDWFADEEVDGESFYHPALEQWDWCWPGGGGYGTKAHGIAGLHELYTIKISHIFWDNNWDKHAYDILLMQDNGAVFLPELYDILYPIWEERYSKKNVNLQTSAQQFFNFNVQRIYEHDSIHETIKYYYEPLYKLILKDGCEVAVDKNKFDALPEDIKLCLVYEELFATALERVILPGNLVSYRSAYKWALKQMLTSMSKGWFALWIAEHLSDLWICPTNYLKLHQENADKLVLLKGYEE
jgi:hypothetical protein